ncbi:MAG: DUF3667 domain-containing protein [Saprospiraceae bacterium]
MPIEIDTNSCKKCHQKLTGPYCANCGQAQQLKRINGSFVVGEIGSVLNFQKGILFTLKALLFQPGKSVRTFIQEDRNRLVKPISFIILGSLIYTIAQQTFHFEDGYINYNDFGWEHSSIGSIMKWVSKNYGFVNILLVTFVALWLKLFFRKYNYNFFEILILLYFIFGVQMILFSIFGIAGSMVNINLIDNGGAILIMIYFCWAIGQFFEGNKITNFFKALLSYFLGLIFFIVILIIAGSLIDWMVK